MAILAEVSENEYVREWHPLSKAIISLIPPLCDIWQTVELVLFVNRNIGNSRQTFHWYQNQQNQ